MALNHKNFAETTLAAAVTTTDGTEITVTSSASFPAVDFIISIGTEAMLVTNVTGVTWTVTRGYESSTAATHLNGAAIYHDWSAAEADGVAPKASPTFTGTVVVPDASFTYAKLQHVSDTDKVLGRSTAGAGDIEEIACTAAGRALLDDAAASNQVTTLGFKSTAAAISTRLMGWKVFDDATAVTTGDGKVIWSVPPELNGMNLVSVFASVSTVSSSGLPTVSIENLTDTAVMLSTLLTIDATEYDSSSAAAAAVIDTAEDDVVTGDRLEINVDTAGTGTKGLFVVLGFALP